MDLWWTYEEKAEKTYSKKLLQPIDFPNGEYGIRTRDLRLARAALSHLS
jgi:hypothetical protein